MGLVIVGGGGGFVYLVALVLALKQKWTDRRCRSRTFYALSDHRAICWLPAGQRRGVKVVTIPYRSIGSVHRIEREDGSGSVRFTGNIPDAEFAGFESVFDVRLVERLAREVLVDPDYRGFPDPDESEFDD